MSEDTRLHLEVTLDLGADMINGTLDDGAGSMVEFTGYLELMSAFDTVTARANDSRHGEAKPGATTDPGRLRQEPKSQDDL